MQKIIDGKLYDTETALAICDVSEGDTIDSRSAYFDDTLLYRTVNGTYFIAGGGGPRGRWGRPVEGGVSSGRGLRLVSEDEARSMVEQHSDIATYTKAFGPPAEG